MKQIICLIVLAVMFTTNVSAKITKEVVIFSQPCRFCDLLKKDLNENLISEYPNIKFTVLDIREQNNRRLLDKYARQHNLHGDIGMPLIFVGENYLMGWSEENKKTLKKYISSFEQEQISRLPSSDL